MRRWFGLLLVVIALSGCGLLSDDRVDATAAEMTGTWLDASSGNTIELNESGSFTASDVAPLFAGCAPTCLPEGFNSVITASGTWEVGPPTGAKGPSNYVHLRINTVDYEPLRRFIPSSRPLRIERDASKVLYLAHYRGDPDLGDKWKFYKS